MQENERQILRQFAVDLKSDVIPIEMLPYLWCLTEDDCEAIQYKQDREGPRAAVPTLLERLKKRKGAFKQLLTALEQTGCEHLKTLLQNAMKDHSHHPEPEHNSNTMTPDTTSNVGSESLKTPTTETARPSSEPSLTKTKLPLKPVPSNRPKKTPNKKKDQIPKENTTSPPETKTYTKTKTKPLKSQPPPTISTGAKQVTAKMTGPPQKSSVSQKVTKCSSKPPQKPICTSDPAPTSQPSETDFIENPTTTHFDTLLCYAKEDCDIALELKQFLETTCGLTVCIDLINFIPGKATADNICESINSSQSIVFLLSPEFPRKLWAPWELKQAVYHFNASHKDGKHKKIIPVLLKECEVPDDLKIYTAIKMGRPGSRKDTWEKIAKALLHNDGGDGVKDSVDGVDDVDVSNNDGDNDEVDNGITDDSMLDGCDDGYDDGDDNHSDSNNGVSEVGANTGSSDNAVDESNNGDSYDDVVGTGNNNEGDDGGDDGGDDDGGDDSGDDDGDDDGDDGGDGSDDGGNDCIRDGNSCEDDDVNSNDGVDDCSGGGDHDEDGNYAKDSESDGADGEDILDGNHVGYDSIDHADSNFDHDEAGDDKHLNQNVSGPDDSVGECDDSGDNNVSANNKNKDDNAYNNIKSL